MANYDHLIGELSKLNQYEKVAYDSYLESGAMLRHGQYLYLAMHGTDSETVQGMNEPPALHEQGQIVESFHERYGRTGLTEHDFMPADLDIAVEKLLTTPNPRSDSDLSMFERLGLTPIPFHS